MKKNDDFELIDKNLPKECKDPEISKDDFVLTTVDGSVHEQKFQTKPTTFVKDSFRRFKKNKSSVVAAYILGVLVLLAIIVPIASPWDVKNAAPDTAFYNLEPKLFNDANGFWDGTVKKSHIEVDTTKPEKMPDPEQYPANGIKNITYEPEQYTTVANKFGNGGYVQFGFYKDKGLTDSSFESAPSSTTVIELDKDLHAKPQLNLNTMDLTLKKFETVNAEKIKAYRDKDGGPGLPADLLPYGFELGKATLNFVFIKGAKVTTIPLTDSLEIHNTGSELPGWDTGEIDINEKIAAETEEKIFDNFYISISVSQGTTANENWCSLVKNMVIECEIADEGAVSRATKAYFEGYSSKGIDVAGVSFDDATEMICRKNKLDLYENVYVPGYYNEGNTQKFVKKIFLSKCTYATFMFDSYEATLGTIKEFLVPSTRLDKYKALKYISYSVEFDTLPSGEIICTNFTFKNLNPDKCPIINKPTAENVMNPGYDPEGHEIFDLECTVLYYKYLGYDQMPSFLFGTDKTGRDMFKYVFEGLRNSLLLGLLTFVVCFIFGLAWGAISGYFGGAVDLIMERVTDILSGIPWIVVMTLVILKSGQQTFWVLALALCLTGWIGTANLTRTQFYRFRGREYVLASRTLGASHARLITKHILPNAMGTIITSCVLMIPFIIFEEATISYLGLGFKGLSSLGVILSDNQAELLTHPYQLIFPSIIIALVMISFNLFGNGLRDAINPSLKGEEE